MARPPPSSRTCALALRSALALEPTAPGASLPPSGSSGSHHLSSTGHGPAHQLSRRRGSCRPGQARRIRGEQSPAGHPHRVALGVEQFDRIVEQHGRRRLGELTRPGLARIGPRHRLVTQRRERDAFGGPTAAAEHRHLHRLRPEQALNPHQGPPGPQPVVITGGHPTAAAAAPRPTPPPPDAAAAW